MASREDIRSAAFPLFAEQGIAQTTSAQIAAAAGITESELAEQFASPVAIALVNDHYARLLEVFLAESPTLSPSAAWIIALDEAASEMDATTWANETARQRLVMSDSAVLEHAMAVGADAMALTRNAVAQRTGLPADSPKVASFTGALIGSIAGMPSGDFADPASWIAAHAGQNETLGTALDKLLR